MSNHAPSPTSRRTEGKQHIIQRHLAGEITAAKRDEMLARYDIKKSGSRATLRQRAKLATNLYTKGTIDVVEWRKRLAAVRDACTAAGLAPIPEAVAVEPQDTADTSTITTKAGKIISAQKATALEHLHTSRRGVRIHPLPAKVQSALTLIRELLNEHNTASGGPLKSARKFALEIDVQPRTVGRWLDGELHPDPRHHPAIMAWRDACKASIPKAAR